MDEELKKSIQSQIDFLTKEFFRVKEVINYSGFNCTTAPAVIVREYRNMIKRQLEVLRANLED